MDTPIEKLITARDVADLLSLSTHSVLDMAQDGRLKSFKIGGAVRFRESEIAAYIDSCRRVRACDKQAGATSA
jgi:excisionase family DNA binding protein